MKTGSFFTVRQRDAGICEMDEKNREKYRYFLKDSIRQQINFTYTDQNRGVPVPPMEKPCPQDALRVTLPDLEQWKTIAKTDLIAAIGHRKSHRVYRSESLTLEELASLLWSTQGVRGKPFHGHAYRTVPSAGCRHALETYLAVLDVEGLSNGIYRYLPLTHELLFEFSEDLLGPKLVEASLGQPYPGRAAVTFIWTAIPYRMEWRYDLAAHKVILLDAGHVCQNLYLACEAIDAGTCAIAAYDQELMDRLLGVDGVDEFVIYLAPVGKVST